MKFALLFHLLAFGLGFGTMMLVDIVGALWVLGRVKASQLIWLTGVAQKVIWGSIIVLVISGSFLLPEVISVRTRIKLVAVVVLIANGFGLDVVRTRLISLGQDDFWKLPRKFQLRSILAISLSQLAWWTAVIIGFLNSSTPK